MHEGGGDRGGAPPNPATGDRVIAPGRERLFKIAFALLPVVAFLLLEAVLALHFRSEYPGSSLAVQGQYRYVADPYRGYANNPGYVRQFDGVSYRYNNYGFREEEDFDLSVKEPNEFRVFLLGGSAAYGTAATPWGQYRLISGQKTYPSSETISAHLARELQQALPGRRVRVINAAVTNYRLANVFFTYLELIRSLAPDLLITMDGYNENWRFTNPYADPVGNLEKGGPLVTWLRKHSYTLFYAGIAYRDSVLFARLNNRFQQELGDEDFARMDLAEIRRHVAQASSEARRDDPAVLGRMHLYELFWYATKLDGVPLLFAIQPATIMDQTKPLTAKEEKLVKYLWHLQWYRPQIRVLAEHLAERARRDPDFHVVNLLDVFADFEEDAYVDYCHLTPSANRHVARVFRDWILAHPELLTKPAPAATHAASAAPVGADALPEAAAIDPARR